MPRSTTLTFRLSSAKARDHLLHELALHDGVAVRAVESAEHPVIAVRTAGTEASSWEIRATVSAFDAAAVEIGTQP